MGPSTPVEIIGFSELPQAGDTFHVLRDDHLAREISLRRQELQKETKIKHVSHITLEDLYKEIQKVK